MVYLGQIMQWPWERTAPAALFGHALALALACTGGCGTEIEVVPRGSALVDYPDCAELGTSIVQHACFHAERGPFGDGVQPYPLAASIPADFTVATANVNAVHTLFAVTLPGNGAGMYEGSVRYRPNRTGDWAIFTTPDAPVPAPVPNTPAPAVPDPPRPMVPIRVLSATGAVPVKLPVELEHAVPGCNRLPHVGIFKLTAGQTYQIAVGPSGLSRVGLVLEKLGDFEAAVFRDADGDGHGAAAASRITACKPPNGYVSKDDDCNDTAAAVFPGAAELCNGADDDCDGTSDEELGVRDGCGRGSRRRAGPRCRSVGGRGRGVQRGPLRRCRREASVAHEDASPPPSDAAPPPATIDAAAADVAAADQSPPQPADGPPPDVTGSGVIGSGDGCGCALGRQPRPTGGVMAVPHPRRVCLGPVPRPGLDPAPREELDLVTMMALLATSRLIAQAAAPSEPAPPPAAPLEVTIRGETRAPPAAAGDYRLQIGQLRDVPRRSAEQLLTLAPGLLLTRYGGEGHASAIFLRGFDAREGQDVELQLAGIPLNDVANPHGHGYADTNFIIPELVTELRVLEGPFDARQGDFAVAGSARYELGLPERGVTALAGYGSFGSQRALLLWGPRTLGSKTFAGVELAEGDGFGPNRAHTAARLMAQYEWAAGSSTRVTVLGTGYASRFDGAGVIRQDDLHARRLPCGQSFDQQFFCTYDPNQGGTVVRHGLATRLLHLGEGGQWDGLAFVTLRQQRLRENFTGFRGDLRTDGGPQRGDGVEQPYDATTVGTRGAYRVVTVPESWVQAAELGYGLRYDVGSSQQRRLRQQDGVPYRLDLDNRLSITNLSVYGATRMVPWPRLTVSAGIRLDTYVSSVVDRNRPDTDRTGHRETSDASEAFGYALQPKLGAELRLVSGLRAVASAGVGTRSSDPQALSDGEFAPFARVRAAELGLVYTGRVRAAAFDARAITFATRVDRDLVFDETAGRNILAGASNRFGALASVRLTARPGLDLLASGTYAEAYLPAAGAPIYQLTSGSRMPYIPRWVLRGDGSYQRTFPLPWPWPWPAQRHGWAGLAGGVTYVAPRPLPYEQVSPYFLSVDAAVRLGAGAFEATVQVTNLLDRRNHDAVYNYTSNFRGAEEPASLLPHHHFSAAAPRAVFISLAYRGAQMEAPRTSATEATDAPP